MKIAESMENTKSRIFFSSLRGTLLAVFLVVLITLCISGTAISQDKGKDIVDREHYMQLEKEYLTNVKTILEENGYQNSGVTMTKVMEEDGNREYTITIHNSKINMLSEMEQEALLSKFREIGFPISSCFFCHEFLKCEAS